MRRRDLIVGLALGAIVLGVGLWTAWWVGHTVQKDARLAGLPIPVQALPARVQTLRETIGASGVIEPSLPLSLSARVSSRVLRVPVDLGMEVRSGTLLVEFDPRLYQARLESARATYDHARRQLERMQALARKQFAAAVDLETARMAEASAHEALVRAEIDLSNTRLLSPAPAVVLVRTINPGETPKLDQDLMQLGVLDPVLLAAEVSEDKIGSVYLGMPAEVGTDAFPGESFHGTVAKIGARVSDATRTFAVYIQLPNPQLRLKKGVTGYARLESTRMALAVPSSALVSPVGDRAAVFVVGKDKRAHIRAVRRGALAAGLIELLDGVDEGEAVVTAGQFDLHDNDPVSLNHFAPWNTRS